MRVIAGLYRGRVLKILPGQNVRPTPSRLRETLFDVLGSTVGASVFVDAYAGSGAVGIEALSRGARLVYFLEKNNAAAKIIEANLKMLDVGGDAKLVCGPALKGLHILAKATAQDASKRPDFLFADPPYHDSNEYQKLLETIAAKELLNPDGTLILQYEKRALIKDEAGPWRRVREITQGSNILGFYRRVSL